MNRHTHRAINKESKIKGWMHCVTPERCADDPRRERAHGNIVSVDICSCGATREAESNGGMVNYGPWMEAA